jgi:hypothetical protein
MKSKINNTFMMFGMQPVGAATERVIGEMASMYTFPTAPMKLEIVSASANDASAGTGIRTVEIIYLDGDYKEKKEVVTLNGTTVVETVAEDIFRVNAFRAVTAGSGGVAAGIISLRNLADTPVYAQINALERESKQFVYTVPAGKVLLLEDLCIANVATTTLKYSHVKIQSNYDPVSDEFRGVLSTHFQTSSNDTLQQYNLRNPLRFPAKADVVGTTIGIAAGIPSIYARGKELAEGEA